MTAIPRRLLPGAAASLALARPALAFPALAFPERTLRIISGYTPRAG